MNKSERKLRDKIPTGKIKTRRNAKKMLKVKAVTLLKKKEIVITPSTQKIQEKIKIFEQKGKPQINQ
jgi:hypothetical protein